MTICLHGSDSNSPGNHEKVLQLQFIGPDARLISYSTRHPKHDVQRLLREANRTLQLNVDEHPLVCGVGLDGYWAEWISFLYSIRQVIFNPNLFPYENMEGEIDRPKEYADIATKCVTNSRGKNRGRCLAILSYSGEALNSQQTSEKSHHYYKIVWDEEQTYKLKNIFPHLQCTRAFKTLRQVPSSHQATLSVPDMLRVLWIGQGVHAAFDNRVPMPDALPTRPTERPVYTPHSISFSQTRSNSKQQTLFFDPTR